MNKKQARRMSELTKQFYLRAGESFFATRQNAWSGWERVLDTCTPVLTDGMRVLDLAAGNLRFERLLATRVASAQLSVYEYGEPAYEAPLGFNLDYRELDLAEVFLSKTYPPDLVCKEFDLAVCMAFSHHLPMVEQRLELLRFMLASVRPGGFVACSFWRFDTDEKLLSKACTTTALAEEKFGMLGLSEGDYLMGWQDSEELFRFCHASDDGEIDELLAELIKMGIHFEERARFSADGRNAALNRYLVLQKSL